MQTGRNEATPSASRGRTLAYRILAGVLGLAVVVLSVPFAVLAFVDEADAIHRMHNLSGAIGFGGLIGALLIVTAWRPTEQVAAFRVVTAASAGGVIAGAISGDLVGGGWLIPIVALAILIPLHPERGELFAFRSPDPTLVALSVLAAIPGIAFALTQAALQRNGVPSLDPHAELHRYSGMAAAGITIPLVGLAASFGTA
ncbi:MAG: hypothetical protein KatS3mg014_0597 [Actinomycetota bacterium]|nr:MAG: hypothetical protein KatS3mg014_0597 [Actinomycetota bacterium]